MTPDQRYMAAFLAASLKAGRPFTHVHDHDAGRLVAVGGAIKPSIDIVEGTTGARYTGQPDAVLNHATQKHFQIALEKDGFAGYDYASEKHFTGVFADQGAVQLFDHETGRYHDFHVS